jgi:hypothetical protein
VANRNIEVVEENDVRSGITHVISEEQVERLVRLG